MCIAAGISGTGEESSAVEKPIQSAVQEKAEVEKLITKKKRRLDEICSEQHPEYSRNVIQSWIAQGKVLVDGKVVTKSGAQVKPTSKILINAVQPKYVCRAGLKMEGALKHFNVAVEGRVALDAGLSTGGFTDCLLENGVERVYGVDVGWGQVAEKIRVHKRVVVMERTNLRHLQDLPEPVSLVTLDLSFISVLKVMPAVCRVLSLGGDVLVLIKPQFEAKKGQVGRGGVVRDPEVHTQVIEKVSSGMQLLGFEYHGFIKSPIVGQKSGNTEFLAHFTRISLEMQELPEDVYNPTADEDDDDDGGDDEDDSEDADVVDDERQ
eukprot:CAMPEP_0198213432 /NCGR_PEP_ID=MMETSP1445-20131203/28863_1 /TAXON_ID=36898 /ORGANISM="Pyramimonas sp., Strain CCMP2087" /LENGTH=321 /DNA_ID=CAMNT_0043888075 /DNA_START=392 /DNA_END=1357 /DNA_ORIENTATION=+